jgi:hypothetical protein
MDLRLEAMMKNRLLVILALAPSSLLAAEAVSGQSFAAQGTTEQAQFRNRATFQSDVMEEERRNPRRFRTFGYYGYGGVGALIDNRESGFFDGAGDVEAVNGSARYDYDRGYPYDHFNERRGAAMERRSERATRCDTVIAWDGGERREVPVRVCRN